MISDIVSKLEEHINELTAQIEGLNQNVAKYKEDSDLRRQAIAEVHTVIQAKEQENKELLDQKLELERKLAQYAAQSQTFDVYKVGFLKSLAKV